MITKLNVLPVIALGLATVAVAEAQIAITEMAVTNSQIQSDPAGGASSFTLSNFNLDGGNALVVAISAETVGTTFNSFSVSFGGTAVTSSVVAISGTTAKQAAGVFYLINPSTTVGDVVVTFNYSSALRSDASVSVFALSNVLGVTAGGTATATATASGPLNLNYSGTTDGFMVMAGVDNKFSGTAVLPLVSGNNVTGYSQRLGYNFDTNPSAGGAFNGSSAQAQAYGSIGATASFTTTYTPQGSGTSTRNAAALVAFDPVAIPEPSTFAPLAGLGALGLAVLRRSRRT